MSKRMKTLLIPSLYHPVRGCVMMDEGNVNSMFCQSCVKSLHVYATPPSGRCDRLIYSVAIDSFNWLCCVDECRNHGSILHHLEHLLSQWLLFTTPTVKCFSHSPVQKVPFKHETQMFWFSYCVQCAVSKHSQDCQMRYLGFWEVLPEGP